MSRLFSELKRRNVIRVGIAYLVAAWLILQLTDVIAPILQLPDVVARYVLLLLIIGFFLALIFAWAYELTPDGIKREQDVARAQSITSFTGRKLDFAIIAMMAVAIVFLVVDNYVLDKASVEIADIERSIAVLPFRNRSNVDEDAFFVDGLHDDLLTQLSRIGSLEKVISRTSTERYRNTTKPMQEIGEELGVANILEGGVQRAGNRVRINVQLIDTRTDEHLWARTYDKELSVENLFDIQSEITREIVTALHGVLSQRDDEALQTMPTTSLAAYNEYVLGRQELAKRTGEALQRAKAHFETATKLDPDYALAWVGLADVYGLLTGYAGVKLEDTWAPHEEALDKALSINPISGEAYANLALLRANQNKLEESEKHFLRAIELNPNYATAYLWYSQNLALRGRLEEALGHARKAIELDPMAPVMTDLLSRRLQILGRTEEAESVLRTGIKRNPEFPGFYVNMADLLKMEGRLGEALKWQEAALGLNPTAPGSSSTICHLLMSLGDDQSAERCIDAFEEAFPDLPDFNKSLLSWTRGHVDDAVALVEEVAEKGSHPIYRNALAQAYIYAGRMDEARSLLLELQPELLGNEDVTVDLPNASFTIDAATLLYWTGERDRANYLFDLTLEYFQTLHRTRGAPFGTMDVQIHVIRGERDKAIAALREAYDMGWRLTAWQLRLPPFNAFSGDPEWDEIVDLFEADLARQRQWYEEHKDEPLL